MEQEKWIPEIIQIIYKDGDKEIEKIDLKGENFLKISNLALDLYDNLIERLEDEEYQEQVKNKRMEIETKKEDFSLQALYNLKEWCEKTNYCIYVADTPIKSSDLEENLNHQENYQFIKRFDILKGTDLPDLIQITQFFQIPSLQEVITVRICSEFYFQQDKASFESLKKKFDVQDDITIEQEEQLQKEYPWLKEDDEEDDQENQNDGECEIDESFNKEKSNQQNEYLDTKKIQNLTLNEQ